MKVKDIIELIDFISNSELNEIKLETDEIKLSVKRDSQIETRFVEAPTATPVIQQIQQPVAPQQTVVQEAPAQVEASTQATEAPAASNQITIKSPMIGTFYRRQNPESPNFVEIGDEITESTTVCVIEAMKLFNEIEGEVAGRIVKVLVEDATPVEYDQPLFIVEPI
jgi:acetyl-CoA carboxylase biotin carboxyl carrier protein